MNAGNLRQALQMQASARRILARLEQGQQTGQRVSKPLTRLLNGEVPNLQPVARQLAMSVRALQDEGTSYRQIVARTQRCIAEEPPCDPGLSIGEVSFPVGFSEPSAFIRAFRKWTGQTPGAFRANSTG